MTAVAVSVMRGSTLCIMVLTMGLEYHFGGDRVIVQLNGSALIRRSVVDLFLRTRAGSRCFIVETGLIQRLCFAKWQRRQWFRRHLLGRRYCPFVPWWLSVGIHQLLLVGGGGLHPFGFTVRHQSPLIVPRMALT